ncbi:hypothetical protein [Niveibacterium sp. SC-1]|uniref:hypothetical protein n=1 Tax=Niveibacterium sp. SC-1 TaxID=3135646 RepID=UPI00311F608B
MDYLVTRHARSRCTQRGIPQRGVELLVAFGREAKAVGGAQIIVLGRKERLELESEFGHPALARLRIESDTFAVTKDGCVLTVGHRLKPVKEL